MYSENLHMSCMAAGEDRHTLEIVPDAMLILSISASVVDDNVSQGDDAGLLEGLEQGLQLLPAAVVAAEVVQLARQVALQCAQA